LEKFESLEMLTTNDLDNYRPSDSFLRIQIKS